VSQKDFEMVQAAWHGRDQEGVEALIPYLHPDIEIVPFGAAFEGRSYCGHDGVRRWWEEQIDPNWTRFETYAESFEEVNGHLVVFGYWIAIGRQSGVELRMPATWVVDVRDGKISRWQTYTDRDEALRDARAG
jgi:ketosteroid isomerase-like protein